MSSICRRNLILLRLLLVLDQEERGGDRVLQEALSVKILTLIVAVQSACAVGCRCLMGTTLIVILSEILLMTLGIRVLALRALLCRTC